MTAVASACIGLITGFLIGFAVRRARLCTFGAVEDAIEGHDFRRLKIFGLSLAVALLGTQGLIAAGYLNPAETSYLPMRSAILSIALGSVMFGLGMALVGTCAFGSLIRLGGGDLRALLVMLIFALSAFATLRGALAPLRIEFVEKISVAMPGGNQAGFIQILDGLSGLNLGPVVSAIIAGLLCLAVVRDRRLHKARRLLLAGLLLGLGVIAGWVATAVLADEFEPLRVQSLTFVAPVARGLFSVLLGTAEWLDFGTMAGLGVALGAFASALVAREFRWEAFDDHHEMKRHIAGAVLMGIGGILAGGCTIGQGLTAGSLLAVSFPIALLGIFIGARIGITILLEGSPGLALSRLRHTLGNIQLPWSRR